MPKTLEQLMEEDWAMVANMDQRIDALNRGFDETDRLFEEVMGKLGVKPEEVLTVDLGTRVYPAMGGKYVIREWDDVTHTVTVIALTEDQVTFRYADGMTHTVSPEYFSHSLNATGVR